jgi:hypothetical protein
MLFIILCYSNTYVIYYFVLPFVDCVEEEKIFVLLFDWWTDISNIDKINNNNIFQITSNKSLNEFTKQFSHKCIIDATNNSRGNSSLYV